MLARWLENLAAVPAGARENAFSAAIVDPDVRLLVGSQEELVSSQVCRTQEEVLTTGEQWQAAMFQKGLR